MKKYTFLSALAEILNPEVLSRSDKKVRYYWSKKSLFKELIKLQKFPVWGKIKALIFTKA